jgi:hypothetical protein
MKLATILATLALLSGCHMVQTEPGQETVIVDYPWFFGHTSGVTYGIYVSSIAIT